MRSLSYFLAVGLIGLWSSASSAGFKAVSAASHGNAAVIHQLSSIRATLNKADHDYQGHRAAAVHQITHAIHLLHHGKHHPNPGQHFVAGTNGKGKGNAKKEPQAASDAQLKQALSALQGVHIPAGKHQAAAQAAVSKAIADLQAALKVA